jgi:hypothetical protein
MLPQQGQSQSEWNSYCAGQSRYAHASSRYPRTNQELRLDRNSKNAVRNDILDEAHTHNSDSSEIDEPIEPCAAPDAEIAYSYDAARGPSHGSTILSNALAQAVERFENNATEKLVKDEYEVLPVNSEEVLTPIKSGSKKSTMAAEEDDYEFV